MGYFIELYQTLFIKSFFKKIIFNRV